MSLFRHVALIGKYHKPGSGEPAAKLRQSLRQALQEIAGFVTQLGCTLTLEAESAANAGITDYPALDIDAIGRQCDVALVVGGDGTMLGASRRLARYGTPLVGINKGRLGFITDIALDNYQQALQPILTGSYEEDVRPLMHASVLRGSECMYEALALNDVVVNRSSTSGMVELRIEVDGVFVSNQRADGVIIASPTGSSAYALSAGGPMLHPRIPGWVMVPIAPHMLSNRPIVLPDALDVVIEVVAGGKVSASFDMHSLASLQRGDRVLVRRSAYNVCFLHPQGWSYFATLRQKLSWNEGGC
ncbi:NAD kinase [Comamonas faecalis]|uniref:NAD kinase n=1 Tax=Comamonas faecalis TaxID=1387849 RepID=A0ABP7R9X8_9BURK